jgi:hypothetical protein
MLRQTRTHDSFKELIGDARKPIVEICHAQPVVPRQAQGN